MCLACSDLVESVGLDSVIRLLVDRAWGSKGHASVLLGRLPCETLHAAGASGSDVRWPPSGLDIPSAQLFEAGQVASA